MTNPENALSTTPSQRNTKPLAVVFDMDDTLYSERQYVLSGYSAAVETLSDNLVDTNTHNLCVFLTKRFDAGLSSNAFDAMNEKYDLGLSKADISKLVETYRLHVPTDIKPYDGVHEILAKLDDAGLKLGLLSDGYLPAQRLKLKALGLERYFHSIVFTQNLGPDAWKPSHRGFELIAARLQVPHAQCVYVGDNLAKDFVAPNALGWRSIQIIHPGQVHAGRTPPPRGEPQKVAHGFAQLGEMLML